MSKRHPRVRRLLAVAAATAAVLASLTIQAGTATADQQNSAAQGWQQPGQRSMTPKIGHVWTIILENKSYEATFTGLNNNSYLWKTLPSYGELLRQYYGTGHYSLDNYISLVSGQSPSPATQADCATYQNVAPGYPAPDGQTYASTGCVYPKTVKTLFDQLDQLGTSWRVYNQDMGKNPAREQVYHCGVPGNPNGAGVPNPGGATPTDQYVPKHSPAAWFHSIIDDPKDCKNVVPLDGYPATKGHQAIPSILTDLKSIRTTPAYSWISPNNCSDAHDATCVGDNLSGDPANKQGGLYAADLFLRKYIPAIMASPAFQKDGEIQVLFDEAFPPYKMYGNSIANDQYAADSAFGTDSGTGQSAQAEANTAQSVVACCNELPGPNTTQPGDQAFGQDTTPGGGITGAVFISRFIQPGSISDQPYNHYSWLRSMEDLFGVKTGGTDGKGHLGYAAADGLRPFGSDVYNNVGGRALRPSATGSSIYPATASASSVAVPTVNRASVPVKRG